MTRALTRLWLAALLTICGFSTSAAQPANDSPQSLDAIRIEQCAGIPEGLVMTTFDSVATSQSYLVMTRIDYNGSTPTYRLTNLRDDLGYQYGLWGQSTEGFQCTADPVNYGKYGFMSEVYMTIGEAQAAGTGYINNGVFERTDFFLVHYIRTGWERTGLVVTPEFIAKFYKSHKSLRMDVTCFSLRYAGAFAGDRTRLGYQDSIPISGVPCGGKEDQRHVFRCLNGDKGTQYRTVDDALWLKCGSSLLQVYSGDTKQTVLSPTFDYDRSDIPQQIDYRRRARFAFDTPMDTDTPASVFVYGTPAVRAYDPYWVDESTIEVTLVGRRQDYGYVGIVAYDHFASPVVEGARSKWNSGLIPLDGDGKGPNRDTKWFSVYSNYVDVDPAASVYAYSVIRDATDVVVSWGARQEEQTQLYRVLHSPTWSDTPETVAEVQRGTGTYRVIVPNGAEGIYWLREVEKDGTVLDQDANPIGQRMTIVNDAVSVTPRDVARGDSLMSAAQQSRATKSMTAGQHAVITVKKFACPANWYRNFWTAWGIPTTVVYLEDIPGGNAGLKAFITAHTEFTSSLLYGGASVIKDVNGNDVWNDPAQWNTMGYGPKPTTPQPVQNAIVGMYYTTDPDSQSVGFPYWMRSWGSVLPYFDRNNNGKPDDGIRFGVAPIADTTDAWGFNYKVANAKAMYAQPTVGLWGYFRAGTNAQWNYAMALQDSLKHDLSPNVTPVTLRDWYLGVLTTQQRMTYSVNHMNERGGLVLSGSVVDDWLGVGKFLQRDQGFSMSMLQSNPGRLTAIISQCGISAYDLWDSLGTPICRPLLNTPDKGAYLIWGPNRGSLSQANYQLVHEALTRLYANPSSPAERPFGDIANEASCAAIDAYPQYANVIRSWVLLGEPNLAIKVPLPPVVGVDDVVVRPDLRISPNPAFGARATVSYRLPTACAVDISVYDVQGRLVANLASGNQSAGTHTAEWNGCDRNGASLSSGVYLVRMQAPLFAADRKVVVLR